mmetsp:Transcript_732/g.2825  ORF Transcript_732/g.2825 Transcript_732/m.2825 type:complete len:476 (+) Transcript_732:1828-3255(+)
MSPAGETGALDALQVLLGPGEEDDRLFPRFEGGGQTIRIHGRRHVQVVGPAGPPPALHELHAPDLAQWKLHEVAAVLGARGDEQGDKAASKDDKSLLLGAQGLAWVSARGPVGHHGDRSHLEGADVVAVLGVEGVQKPHAGLIHLLVGFVLSGEVATTKGPEVLVQKLAAVLARPVCLLARVLVQPVRHIQEVQLPLVVLARAQKVEKPEAAAARVESAQHLGQVCNTAVHELDCRLQSLLLRHGEALAPAGAQGDEVGRDRPAELRLGVQVGLPVVLGGVAAALADPRGEVLQPPQGGLVVVRVAAPAGPRRLRVRSEKGVGLGEALREAVVRVQQRGGRRDGGGNDRLPVEPELDAGHDLLHEAAQGGPVVLIVLAARLAPRSRVARLDQPLPECVEPLAVEGDVLGELAQQRHDLCPAPGSDRRHLVGPPRGRGIRRRHPPVWLVRGPRSIEDARALRPRSRSVTRAPSISP